MFAAGREEDFRTKVEAVLQMMHADRDDDIDEKIEDVRDFVKGQSDDISGMTRTYAKAVERFAHLDNVAALEFGGQYIGDHGHLVLVPARNPDELTMATVAEHKGEALRALFDELVDEANQLWEPEEFIVGYALLAMTRPEQIEMLVRFDFDDERLWGDLDVNLYSRGDEPFINAGQFNLETLLDAR